MGNLFYSLAGAIAYVFGQWLILISITQFLGLEVAGVYAIALGIVVPVNMVFNFGIRQVTVTHENENIKELINYLLLSQLIGFSFVVIFCFFYNLELLILVSVLYMLKIVESIYEYIYGLRQRVHKHLIIAKSRLFRSLIGSLSFFCFLYIFRDLKISVLLLFIVNLSFLLFYDKVIELFRSTLLFNSAYEIFFKVGFPLAITAGLLSFKSVLPRFLIESEFNYSEVGIFVSFLYLLNAGNIVVQSLAQVYVPIISNNFNTNKVDIVKKTFFKGFNIVFLFSTIAVLLIILIGQPIAALLFSPEIKISKMELYAYSLIAFLTYISSYLGYCCSAVRDFKFQPFMFLILLILTYLIGDYALSFAGVFGFLIAISLVFFIQLIVSFYRFFFKLRISGEKC